MCIIFEIYSPNITDLISNLHRVCQIINKVLLFPSLGVNEELEQCCKAKHMITQLIMTS